MTNKKSPDQYKPKDRNDNTVVQKPWGLGLLSEHVAAALKEQGSVPSVILTNAFSQAAGTKLDIEALKLPLRKPVPDSLVPKIRSLMEALRFPGAQPLLLLERELGAVWVAKKREPARDAVKKVIQKRAMKKIAVKKQPVAQSAPVAPTVIIRKATKKIGPGV